MIMVAGWGNLASNFFIMSTENMFVIGKDLTQLWSIVKTDIDLMPNLQKQLLGGMSLTLKNFMQSPNPNFFANPSTLVLGPSSAYVILKVKVLRLECHYVLTPDNLLFPAFGSSSEADQVLAMNWIPPETMSLLLLLGATNENTPLKSYLVAVDRNRGTWRLPLSNLYDDCQLCNGRRALSTTVETFTEYVVNESKQFVQSPWNSDLYTRNDTAGITKTRALFGWAHSKGEFKQLSIQSNWMAHCESVASAVISNILKPIIQ